MILPAVLVAAALCAGIVGGTYLNALPLFWLGVSAGSWLAAVLLVRRGYLRLALTSALACWALLGAGAASLERRAIPPDHVTLLVAKESFPADTPLRWRGRLRSNPVPLGWGARAELELEEVELAGRPVRVEGGLRVNWYREEGSSENFPALRAGERVEVLARARRPRNFQNPGAFDFRNYLARHGIHLTASLRSVELLRKLDGPRPEFRHRTARIRGALLARLDSMFAASPQIAAVLRGMLLGDYSFIDHDVATAFQRTAVYHVLVISGMHLVALAAFVYWVARLFRLPVGLRTILTILVLGGFVAIVEDSPPVARAAVMAALVLLARLLFRRVDLLNSVAVAGILLLLASPASLFDPSFQLSFLAAATIGALALPAVEGSSGPYRRALTHLSDVTRDAVHPPRAAQLRLDLRVATAALASRLPAKLAGLPRRLVTAPLATALLLWEVFLVSTVIQIVMLPLMAGYFHRISLSGPLANIPAVVLSGVIVPLGFLSLLFEFLSSSLGALFAELLRLCTAALLATVDWFSRWPAGAYRIPAPPPWLLVGFFAAVVSLSIAARLHLRRAWRLGLCALLAVLVWAVATFPLAPATDPGKLSLTVLDVGQGDALFLAAPDGRTMLIDAGGQFPGTLGRGFRRGIDIGEQVVSPFLWHLGLKRIDIVLLTHAHLDHMDGIYSVLDNFRVGQVWISRGLDTPAFRELLARASARGTNVVYQRRGERFAWGGMVGEFLWPESNSSAAEPSNNDSLVVRLSFGGFRFLLPGDIEGPVEEKLVAFAEPLGAQFLKIPHHGSKSSTSPGFLAAVAPAVAAVSVADSNPFGHPHPDVLARLENRAVRILRTDRNGAIRVTTDGRSIVVSFPRD